MIPSRPEHDGTELPVIPAAGAELELLDAYLDYQRAVARRKAERISASSLRQRLPGHPSLLTIGGVLKHLSWVEIKWSQAVFLGYDYDEIDEPWAGCRDTDPDWQWDVSTTDPDEVLDLHDRAVGAARAAFAAASSPSSLSRRTGCADPGEDGSDDNSRYQLRWILIHLIEEYARHNGHLDLLREAVDGATGN